MLKKNKKKNKQSPFKILSAAVVIGILTITTLWANSADDRLMTFFLYFSQKTGFDISCKSSPIDSLHEISKPVFWEK